MNQSSDDTSRILVIDDNELIHEDFRKILCATTPAAQSVDDMAAALLGGAPAADPSRTFEVDAASQGRDGVAMAQKAVENGSPYTVAFVDVRMPPGWDGIETIEHLWKVDPEIQTVICTAYSDFSADNILQRLGVTDRLLILKKPFDVSEVLLLASTLSAKWRLVRATAAFTESMVERAFAN